MLSFPLEPQRAAKLMAAFAKHPMPVRTVEELRALDNRDHRPVHAAADSRLKSFTVAIRYAFARGRSAIRAVPTSKAADVAAAAVRNALLDVLPSEVSKALEAGGKAGASMLKTAEEFRAAKKDDAPRKKSVGSIKMSFDITNPDAIDWAKKHVAKLAKELSDTTREDTRSAIARSLETGDDPYDEVLDAVGDDVRASMIARTETMTAANEGQRQSWEQAVEEGLLPEGSQVAWIATSGCCDECDALDGETRDLDGEYPDPGGDGPPLHPNCRCTEGIVA